MNSAGNFRGQQNNRKVTPKLGKGHEQQKDQEPLAHNSCRYREGITDNRHPTQQQAPFSIALVPLLRLREFFRR
jgi:hypothetical protein